MGNENINTDIFDQNVDLQIMILFERLESIRRNLSQGRGTISKCTIQREIRTLEFWRSIICECLASFFYVFIVCGAAAGAGVGASVSSVLLATALASGLAMGALTHCFVNISGAHINPAVSLAAFVAQTITPLRTLMYVIAQCGGGIAGAALLYGVTVPGYQGNLQAAISHNASLMAWERLGVELILTCVVVLSYFVGTEPLKKLMGSSGIIVGTAYSACSFVSMPYLNPARSLGASVVLNKWECHWVYWFGPLIGGLASGVIYEYIFTARRNSNVRKIRIEHDSSLMPSEDERNYDMDVEKQNVRLDSYQHNRNEANAASNNPQTDDRGNLYARTPTAKQNCNEPIYGGTRSLYCRSPTLGRTNLNRSQSVYAKSNTAINKDNAIRSGPLVPAQSLYPIRVPPQKSVQTLSSHAQNLQNQMQQHTEGIYGVRNSTRQSLQQQQPQAHHQASHPMQKQNVQQSLHNTDHMEQSQGCQSIYVPRQNAGNGGENSTYDCHMPESIYGKAPGCSNSRVAGGERNMPMQRVKRGQSVQSDDSSYGSYHGTAIAGQGRHFNEPPMLMYAPPPLMGALQNSPTIQSNVRTQSERKNIAPVVSKNIAPSIATYTVTAPTHGPNQQMYMASRPDQEQHYSLLSMRSNS